MFSDARRTIQSSESSRRKPQGWMRRSSLCRISAVEFSRISRSVCIRPPVARNIADFRYSVRPKLRRAKRLTRRAEHPVENHVDVLQMIIEVEQLLELVARQLFRDLEVVLE